MKYRKRYAQASSKIHYIKVGGSYQLVRDYAVETDIFPELDIKTERIHLLEDGRLYILSGYCWDGASGPVIDRKTNMRAGCGHDALYQLMRMGFLDHYFWRASDKEFSKVLLQDGAWDITAWADLKGLWIAGGAAALPKNRKKRFTAP